MAKSKPPIILYRLNKDLSRVLQKYLSRPHWLEDRCVAEIIALLERRLFREQLLFRDYSQYSRSVISNEDETSRGIENGYSSSVFSEESLFYVGMFFSRRITLANALQAEPTSMHNLLLFLCKKSQDINWSDAMLMRRFDCEENIEDFFLTVAKQLKKQHDNLNGNYSANSKGRLAQYGPYWLIAQRSASQVAEELSLSDVLRAIPCPMIQGFTDGSEWEITFAKIIETLNERYGLLRNLGLRPDIWMDREKPLEFGEKIDPEKSRKLMLSTDNLKELKKLKKYANDLLRTGEERKSSNAYKKVFDDSLGDAKALAGFQNFEAFERSEVGQHLLGEIPEEVDLEQAQNKHSYYEEEGTVNPYNISYELHALQERMLELLEAYPDLFDPVLAYFFKEAFGNLRAIYGQEGLLEDPEFMGLVASDDKYRSLSENDLVLLLEARIKRIIQNQLQMESAS